MIAHNKVSKHPKKTPTTNHPKSRTPKLTVIEPVVLPESDNDTELTDRSAELYTPGEVGQLDQEPLLDKNNPQAVQGGRGPLRQEGEGNRQNSEMAELEDRVDAAKDLDDRR